MLPDGSDCSGHGEPDVSQLLKERGHWRHGPVYQIHGVDLMIKKMGSPL